MDGAKCPLPIVEARPEKIQSPEAATAGPEAEIAGSEARTAGLEAVTADPKMEDYRYSLEGILKGLIQGIKKDRKLKDGRGLEDDYHTKILGQLRATLGRGAPEDPVPEDELISIPCRRVQHTLHVIKGLGAESQETNFMIRMALWTAAICYGALAPSKSSSHLEVEERELDEPLIHVLLSYVLLENDNTQLFEKYFKDLGSLEVDRFNSNGVTPLYVAIKKNNLEMVKAITQKGNWQKVSQANDSALHVAFGHPVIFKYLLERFPTDKGPYNKYGYAPIHLAVICNQLQQFKIIVKVNFSSLNDRDERGRRNCLHLAVENESVEIVEAIFERLEEEFGNRKYSKHIITSQLDNEGLTPFHAALQGKNKTIIGMFLRNGASLSEKRNGEKTALEIIAKHFNDASSILRSALDDSINMSATSDKIIIDYNSFTDINDKHTSQIKAIDQIVECGQNDLLLHPVIISYVYLKWNYFLPLIYILISVHGILLITFNVLVANIFYYGDKINITKSTNQVSKRAVPWSQQELDWSYWRLIILMYAIITVLIVQESFTIYIMRQQWRHHFADQETWMRLVFLVLAIFLPMVLACAEPADWQRHLACAMLLLGWLQAMFLLSRFPLWGNYVLMFGRVACDLLKILASMMFLIIGFSFCFMIEYQSKPPFDEPLTAFFKTLVMMLTGFERLFENDCVKELRNTKVIVCQLFGFFIIFVAVTLINLMTSTATNDINELTVMAEKQRLEKQVELLETMEAIIYNKPYAKILNKVLSRGRYYKQIEFSITRKTKWILISANVTCTGSKMNIREQSSEIHSFINLREAFVEISKKNEQREEKKNISITKKKIEEVCDAFPKKPEGEVKGNKDWVRKVAAELKCNIEDMNSKIEKLISNQTQISDSFKELTVKVQKLRNTKPVNKRRYNRYKI